MRIPTFSVRSLNLLPASLYNMYSKVGEWEAMVRTTEYLIKYKRFIHIEGNIRERVRWYLTDEQKKSASQRVVWTSWQPGSIICIEKWRNGKQWYAVQNISKSKKARVTSMDIFVNFSIIPIGWAKNQPPITIITPSSIWVKRTYVPYWCVYMVW